jgi:hypothetical protein
MDDDAAETDGSRDRRLAQLVGWVLFSLGGLLLAATVGETDDSRSAGWSGSEGGPTAESGAEPPTTTGSGAARSESTTRRKATETEGSLDGEEDWFGVVLSGGLLLLIVVAVAWVARPAGLIEYVVWTLAAGGAWALVAAGLAYTGFVPAGALAAGPLAALFATLALAGWLLAALFTFVTFLVVATAGDVVSLAVAVGVAVACLVVGVVSLRALDADRRPDRRTTAAALALLALFGLVALPAQVPTVVGRVLPFAEGPVSVADRVVVFVGVLPVPAGKVVATMLSTPTDRGGLPVRRQFARVAVTGLVATSLFVLAAEATDLLSVDLGGLTALVFVLSLAATVVTDVQSVVG